MDRRQLAEFLRGRRSRVQPGDVGLSAGLRRRTPGLRREEVARLAGISVDYYTRLEQARGPRPSRQVLGALARALRLAEDERKHLYHLAGEVPGPVGGPSRDVPVGILRLLDRLDDTPAFVLDAKYDVLAWNHMAVALLGDFAAIPEPDRNLVWQVFCGPRRVDLYPGPDADAFAEECVANLRAAAARYPDDPGIRRLLQRLRATSPEFVRRWERHWVCVRRDSTKRLHHPVVGELELECDLLDIPDRDQRLVIYTAAPGSRSAEALRLLDVVGTQWPNH
ncbi:MAG: helix-turn-helix domain-containing protein [Micromonosporaceae bacterium]|nr:helix-turn-helix domain-containing protein [Micromonosporaceae bacterium]